MSVSAKVVAVVVTWNRKELLARNLRAVLAQSRPVDEILVVDNASTDGTPEMLAAEFPQVRVIRLAGNAGSAGGFHVGVREGLALGADWLWLMDDDGLPTARCLEKVLNVAEKEKASICGPLVVSLDDPSKLAVPLLDPNLPQSPDALRLIWQNDFHPYVKPPLFNGVLVRRDAAMRCGAPKAEMFIWGEDNEYCERLVSAGYKAGIALNATYLHPDLSSRGWWLIDINVAGCRIRKCLLCEPTSARFGIVVRNVGYRAFKYYGVWATAAIFAFGTIKSWLNAGGKGAWQFCCYFVDGVLDRYSLVPSRDELRRAAKPVTQ